MDIIFTEMNGDKDFLEHYGRGHLDGGHSGRYPWGSGDDSMQRGASFMSRLNELETQMPHATYTDPQTGKVYTGEAAYARMMNLTTTQFRLEKQHAVSEDKESKYRRAELLFNETHSYTEVARKMGLKNESVARSYLKAMNNNNYNKAKNTAEFLKKIIDEEGKPIDVGPGVESSLGIKRNKLDEAVYMLQMEGYVNAIGRRQHPTDPTGSKQTTYNVIGPPDMAKSAVYEDNKIKFLSTEEYNKFRDSIGVASLNEYVSKDNGETYEKKFNYPTSIDSDRVKIRYLEDGGAERDGLIEIRRNVEDLDLKGSTYAQVRIMVDNDKYLKGMAVYADDSEFDDGVDIIFNSHHSKDEVYNNLKPCKRTASGEIDAENPFGSSIKPTEEGGQYWYINSKGEKKLGAINKTREEGDWSEWADRVPSQFLSKQSNQLAERQLKLALKDKRQEYEDIVALENNTLKKSMLDSFASECDYASVHLFAAALPRQNHQVILPMPDMKSNEAFAPNYQNGEQIALVRYPHGGTFEIPILTVNNKAKAALKSSKLAVDTNSKDCVGINSEVAARLSGADFDGDTVMVIPLSDQIHIKSRPQLEGLKNYDHQTEYGTTEKKDSEGNSHYYNKYGNEVHILKAADTEMGKITNLITDMTVAGATDDELARAVRHSMTIIDSVKHKLDYRSSEKDNGIQQLKEKYQSRILEDGTVKNGAATIISRAKGEVNVDKTQGSARINVKYKKNGELNPDYDSTRPEGALIYKVADDNKLNYVQIKGQNDTTGEKVNLTVYAQEPETGKFRNIYKKSDGEMYYAIGVDNDYKPIEVKYTDEKLFYNKGMKTETDSNGKEKRIYTEVTDEKLEYKKRTEKKSQMELTDDATTLISKYNTRMENLYANYANALKGMANEARKEAYYIPESKVNPIARQTYADEVKSLDEKIARSDKNKPRERQAILIANSRIKAKKESNPGMTKSEIKKLSQRELTMAREKVGARRDPIDVTDKEWEAIQAGAVSANSLQKIFRYADTEDLKERATPRARKEITEAKKNRIEQLAAAGKSNAEIALAVGLSASTVSKYLKS